LEGVGGSASVGDSGGEFDPPNYFFKIYKPNVAIPKLNVAIDTQPKRCYNKSMIEKMITSISTYIFGMTITILLGMVYEFITTF